MIPGLGRSLGEGNGNPLQHSHLENPHGQRSLADSSPWVCKESDMIEQLSTHTHPILSGWLLLAPYPEDRWWEGKSEHTCARMRASGHTRLQGRLENIVQLCEAQEKEEKGFCGQLATFTTCTIQILPQQNKRYYIKSDYGFWGCQKHSQLRTIRTDSAQESIYASSQ